MGFEIKEMADREYFADPALDQSALKRFMVSPLSYVDYLDHGLDVSGDALDFGKAAHALVRRSSTGRICARRRVRRAWRSLRASDAAVLRSGTLAASLRVIRGECGNDPQQHALLGNRYDEVMPRSTSGCEATRAGAPGAAPMWCVPATA